MEKQAKKIYTEAVGRRKTSTARVRLTPSDKKTTITINDKDVREYFKTDDLFKVVFAPFHNVADIKDYTVTAVVSGGGVHSQAEAIRHGIARVLVELQEHAKTDLKKLGFLKRDPRSKERRKFGLKKARKSPQWSKR